MSVVLVTVVGPRGRQDLSLPADVAIIELLATLVEGAGGCGDGHPDLSRWELGRPGESPLASSDTLAACGVVDGTILQLTERRPLPTAPASPARVPSPGGVRARTAELLPVRPGGLERVANATRALLGRDETEPASSDTPPVPATEGPRPSDLAVAQPPSPLARARQAWRASNYLERLNGAIAAPRLQRSATIAVVSPKGGVGKTTLSALVGMLLALLRRDRVVAVDTNPDYGSLGRSLTPDHQLFVDDLLPLLERPQLHVTALDASLGRAAHGLMVLPAPTDPARMAGLDEAAYTGVIRRLHAYVGVTVLDCGTGLQDPAARAAISTADQLVLVTDADPATASLVAEAAQLLAQADRPIVLVVNNVARRHRHLDLDQLAAWVSDATGLVEMPHHAGAAARVAAGTFSWRDAPRSWQVAGRELAAVLVADWPRLGVALAGKN